MIKKQKNKKEGVRFKFFTQSSKWVFGPPLILIQDQVLAISNQILVTQIRLI